MTDAKRAMRIEMRRKRVALTDRSERSASLWAAVMQLCDHAASRPAAQRSTALAVLAFNGVGSEPDTTGLLELLNAEGYSVVLPRVEGDHIVAVAYRPGDPLIPGAYSIPEPTGPAVDPAIIDVVLVPGLAFTRDGRRLGQGGGYYDRFLLLVRAECITCGVGFSEQVVDDLPCEPHDRRLSALVTA